MPDVLPYHHRLSEHFTFGEMTRTNHRALITKNQIDAMRYVEDALIPLCQLLEKVRALHGKPLIPTSGFRNHELNHAVGGHVRSQHLKGQACDFVVSGVPLEDVWKAIRDAGIPLGQCLLEGYSDSGQPSWIHLSLGSPWRPPNRCQQFRRITVNR